MERRRGSRRSPESEESLSRVRLRTGRELVVVDLSNSGALVEGTVRLLPGTHLDVHIVTRDGRVLVRSRVIRAHVSYVDASEIRYRVALAFERTVDTAGYSVPSLAMPPAGLWGSSYPPAMSAPARVDDECLSA